MLTAHGASGIDAPIQLGMQVRQVNTQRHAHMQGVANFSVRPSPGPVLPLWAEALAMLLLAGLKPVLHLRSLAACPTAASLQGVRCEPMWDARRWHCHCHCHCC